ncbi:CAP domain-containing protein [Fusobacterium russii]|uniref:CAP domain-containing protein n=1 Tax=Fusobacterium russii TaxID=854 RepID=UPI001FDFA958|nr:CAP domain-containing protein [Fusobacterium russii]
MKIKKEYSEKYMVDLHKWLPETFEELNNIEEEKLYKLAVEKYHYHNDKKNLYSKEELKKIEKFVDIAKLNKYFVEKLNNERGKRGLSSNIKIDRNLIKAAKIRSEEMAMQSKISHKRPNNEDFWSVIEEVDSSLSDRSSFENALGISIASEAQMLSEKYMAEQFFDSWKESPAHWDAMMNPEIKSIAINFSFGFSRDKNFLSHINYGILLGIK